MILIIHLLQPSKSNLQNQAKQTQVEMDKNAHFSFNKNVKSNIHSSQPNKSPGRAAAPSSGIEILDNPSFLECEFGSNSNVFLFSRESQKESIGQEQEVWLCCEQAGKGGGGR